jgi:hypothetical protein
MMTDSDKLKMYIVNPKAITKLTQLRVNSGRAPHTPVIVATWEAEIRMTPVGGQPG